MSEWVYYLTKNKKEKEKGGGVGGVYYQRAPMLLEDAPKQKANDFVHDDNSGAFHDDDGQAGSMKQFKGILALFFRTFSTLYRVYLYVHILYFSRIIFYKTKSDWKNGKVSSNRWESCGLNAFDVE